MSGGPSSIRKGSRRGTVSLTAVVIGAILVAGAGASAWYFLTPRSAFEDVTIDGSSTVYPITSAWALDFNNPARQVTVAFSGTGGGFSKFCRGETDLSDASRPIRQSERDACAANAITGIVEFKVAYDGLSVVVNPSNVWVDRLTVAQLCRIWTSNVSAGACGGEGGQVDLWSELNGSWPASPIKLYGPGTASGTFDYFIEAVLDPTDDTPIRSDFISSEDDNILVQGIANDADALGYFGYAYVVENLGRVRSLPIDGGSGPVLPTEATIRDGSYAPLSRPLFIYGATVHPEGLSLTGAVVRDFLGFGFTARGTELVDATGYVSLTASEIAVEVAKIPA